MSCLGDCTATVLQSVRYSTCAGVRCWMEQMEKQQMDMQAVECNPIFHVDSGRYQRYYMADIYPSILVLPAQATTFEIELNKPRKRVLDPFHLLVQSINSLAPPVYSARVPAHFVRPRYNKDDIYTSNESSSGSRRSGSSGGCVWAPKSRCIQFRASPSNINREVINMPVICHQRITQSYSSMRKQTIYTHTHTLDLAANGCLLSLTSAKRPRQIHHSTDGIGRHRRRRSKPFKFTEEYSMTGLSHPCQVIKQ